MISHIDSGVNKLSPVHISVVSAHENISLTDTTIEHLYSLNDGCLICKFRAT